MGLKTREKILRRMDKKKVIYDERRWRLLKELRDRGREIMRQIPEKSYVYGSVARGDVNSKSDVDIIILDVIPSYIIEANIDFEMRYIIQATPNSVIKACYKIDERAAITYPLIPMNEREIQFYDFSGKIDNEKERVCGVNKKLIFIEPVKDGHVEWSVIGREDEVARKLNIDVETVQERVRVLSRRDRIGRTGTYMRVEVPENRGVEEYLKIIMDRDPVVRRVVMER